MINYRQLKKKNHYRKTSVNICVYCGLDFEKFGARKTIDHAFIPRSKKGTISEWNVLVCCIQCNTIKGNNDISCMFPRMNNSLLCSLREIVVIRLRRAIQCRNGIPLTILIDKLDNIKVLRRIKVLYSVLWEIERELENRNVEVNNDV